MRWPQANCSAIPRLLPLILFAACSEKQPGPPVDAGPEVAPCVGGNPVEKLWEKEDTVESLQLHGDRVILRTRGRSSARPVDAGPLPGVIMSIGQDGTGKQVLYLPPPGEVLATEIAVQSDAVYFLQSVGGASGEVVLHRVPVTGGAATPFGFTQLPGNLVGLQHIFGIDADAVYASGHVDEMGSRAIYRMALSDGRFTSLAGGHSGFSHRLVGNEVIFLTETGDVMSLPKDGVAAAERKVGQVTCPQSGHLVTDRHIFCPAQNGVLSYDRTTGAATVLELPPEPGQRYVPFTPLAAADGWVYARRRGNGIEPSDLWKVPLAGGAPLLVACGRQEMFNPTVGPTHLFWTEIGPTADTLFKVPR